MIRLNSWCRKDICFRFSNGVRPKGRPRSSVEIIEPKSLDIIEPIGSALSFKSTAHTNLTDNSDSNNSLSLSTLHNCLKYSKTLKVSL